MAKEKRLLPTIAFVTTFILLIVFLFGQCLIVGVFGPNGTYVKLGLNGYPDYVNLVVVSNSKKPTIAHSNSVSVDNYNNLVYHIRNEVSLLLYPDEAQTPELLGRFATGTLAFKPSLGINYASLNGGYLATLLQWGIDNEGYIYSLTGSGVYNFEYDYNIEGITIKKKGTSVHLTCTISMYKTYLTSLLSDTTNAAKQFIETTISTDKAYFNLDFVMGISDGVLQNPEHLTVSINDSSESASYKLVKYINTRTNNLFDVMATNIFSAIKLLGNVAVDTNALIITNRV